MKKYYMIWMLLLTGFLLTENQVLAQKVDYQVDAYKDTYVKFNYDGDHSADASLRIKNDAGGPNSRQAIVTFVLPDSDRLINRATFRIFGHPAGGSPDMAFGVWGVDLNDWPSDIDTIAPVGDSIGAFYTLASMSNMASWYEVDVTQLVLSDADDTVSLMIAELTGAQSDFWARSSEAGKLGPKLVVSYDGTTAQVLQDTYIKYNYDGDHSAESSLRIKNDAGGPNSREALVTFLLPESERVVKKAEFLIYGHPAGSSPDMAFGVWGVDLNTWPVGIDTITEVGDSLGAFYTPASMSDVDAWYTVDVTSLVLNDRDDTISVKIAEITGAQSDFWARSSEAGKLGPKLAITYGEKTSMVLQDTYVKFNYDGDHSAESSLRIKNDAGGPNSREALVTFKLPESDRVIEKAVFSIFGHPAGGSPDMALGVWGVRLNSWPTSIDTIAPLGDSLGAFYTLASMADVDAWYQVEVTPWVLNNRDNDDTISFMIKEMTGAQSDFWARSSEAGKLGPMLEITYGGPTAAVVEDTYVKFNYDGDHSDETNLRIKNDAGGPNSREALITFKLPETNEAITKAELHIFGHPASGSPDMQIGILGVDLNNWTTDIDTIAPVGDSLGVFYTLASMSDVDDWYVVDVTDWVLNDPDDTISVMLRELTGAQSDFWAKSSEAGLRGPKLEITYGGPTAPVHKDTYVKFNYDGDHSAESSLRIKNDAGGPNSREALITFVVPPSDSLMQSAWFWIYGHPAGGSPDMTLGVWGVDLNDWESTIDTIAPLGDSLGAFYTRAQDSDIDAWYRVNVTDWVAMDDDDTISLMVKELTGAQSDFWARASEAGKLGPKLEIVYGIPDGPEQHDPEPVKNLQITDLGKTTVSFSWDVSFDQDGDLKGYAYRLVRVALTLASDTAVDTTISFVDLLPGTFYKFEVMSVDSTGRTGLPPATISFSTLVDTIPLHDSIAAAEALLAGCPGSTAAADLQAAIDNAKEKIAQPDVSQAVVNQALNFLVSQMEAFRAAGCDTGMEDEDVSAILIYPNPSQGMVYIKNLENVAFLEIMNVTGQKVMRMEVNQPGLEVNAEKWAAGLYFVRITDTTGRNITKKLLIE